MFVEKDFEEPFNLKRIVLFNENEEGAQGSLDEKFAGRLRSLDISKIKSVNFIVEMWLKT